VSEEIFSEISEELPFDEFKEEEFLFRDVFHEDAYRQQVQEELKQANRAIQMFADSEKAIKKRKIHLGASWDTARELVSSFQPVPTFLWSGIRGVLHADAEDNNVHPLAFSALKTLMFKGAKDHTLSNGRLKSENDLSAAINLIGKDVAAALCLIHAVVRKIAKRLPERVWQPIVDDALLRAQIGYYVGQYSVGFGCGKAMLAGFSGRSGLGVQVASGDLASAQEAVAFLATGEDINDVGFSVYGCDPLQVSAMTLVAAGCGRSAAIGTACYSWAHDKVELGSEEYKWLAAFSLVENIRIGHSDRIAAEHWEAMNLVGERKVALWNELNRLKRLGTSWRWISRPHYTLVDDTEIVEALDLGA